MFGNFTFIQSARLKQEVFLNKPSKQSRVSHKETIERTLPIPSSTTNHPDADNDSFKCFINSEEGIERLPADDSHTLFR